MHLHSNQFLIIQDISTIRRATATVSGAYMQSTPCDFCRMEVSTSTIWDWTTKACLSREKEPALNKGRQSALGCGEALNTGNTTTSLRFSLGAFDPTRFARGRFRRSMAIVSNQNPYSRGSRFGLLP